MNSEDMIRELEALKKSMVESTADINAHALILGVKEDLIKVVKMIEDLTARNN